MSILKIDKIFLSIMLVATYTLSVTFFHLDRIPFLLLNIITSFFFIFLLGYCITKIIGLFHPLMFHEVVMYSFSIGVLIFSFIGFLFFILHCLPLVKYLIIMLSSVFYILMKVHTKAFEDNKP